MKSFRCSGKLSKWLVCSSFIPYFVLRDLIGDARSLVNPIRLPVRSGQTRIRLRFLRRARIESLPRDAQEPERVQPVPLPQVELMERRHRQCAA